MTTPSERAAGSVERAGALRQIAGALVYLVKTPGLRVLLVCNLVLGMAASFVLPFLSMFGTLEVGMSLSTFGVFMTTTALAGIVVSTWLSHRSDTHLSRRTVLLFGSFAGALGYAGYAFVREPWLLFVIGGGVLGVASVAFSQLFAYAREFVESSGTRRSDVPLFMNAFRMAFALSWTVGPAVAAFTLRKFSFVGLFGVASLFYLVLFALVLAFVKHTPPRAPAPAAAVEPTTMSELVRRPDVIFWFLALTLMLAAHHMSMNNMSLLVLKVLGGSEDHVGVIFSLAPVFELPFMLYVGYLATRVRSARLIRGAMVLAAAYYLGLAFVRTPEQIYPLQAVSAAIVSVTSGVAITFFQDLLPERLGAATNLYANAARVGQTSGYLTFGVVAARFGHRGTALVCGVFAVTALVLTALAVRPKSVAEARRLP